MITNASPVNTSPSAASANATFRPRPLAFTMLLLLALQFFLGMWNNLFIDVPAAHPGQNADNYFVGVAQGIAWAITHSALLTLQLHVILGLLLLLTSIALIVAAYRVAGRAWRICAPIGTFGILAAAFNGASFINYGHDFSSMLMSVGFMIALVSYSAGLYFTQQS